MRTPKSLINALLIMQLGILPGCITVYIPNDEYNLARAAVEAAKETEAARYAPGLWYKAEQAYKEAERLYKERDYGVAKSRFVEAKSFAEKAENAARIARFQSGETAP